MVYPSWHIGGSAQSINKVWRLPITISADRGANEAASFSVINEKRKPALPNISSKRNHTKQRIEEVERTDESTNQKAAPTLTTISGIALVYTDKIMGTSESTTIICDHTNN